MIADLTANRVFRLRTPEAKVKYLSDVKRKLEGLIREEDEVMRVAGRDVTRAALVDPRKTASLEKEGAMRQALREEELHNEVWEEHGDILEQEDLAKLREQPIHVYLSNPDSSLKGRLMSKSAATKAGKHDPSKHGDYDGASGVNRTLYGGDIMPDQAAQELYDEGLIGDSSPDVMWEALAMEEDAATRFRHELEKARAKLKDATKQARQDAANWLKEAQAKQKRDQRQNLLNQVYTATQNGASLTACARIIGLSPCTLTRRKDDFKGPATGDKRPTAQRPNPSNGLTKEERQQVIDICTSPRFASLPPAQIVPTLLDEGTYIASESSYYRILRDHGLNQHRGRARKPAPKKPKPNNY